MKYDCIITKIFILNDYEVLEIKLADKCPIIKGQVVLVNEAMFIQGTIDSHHMETNTILVTTTASLANIKTLHSIPYKVVQ